MVMKPVTQNVCLFTESPGSCSRNLTHRPQWCCSGPKRWAVTTRFHWCRTHSCCTRSWLWGCWFHTGTEALVCFVRQWDSPALGRALAPITDDLWPVTKMMIIIWIKAFSGVTLPTEQNYDVNLAQVQMDGNNSGKGNHPELNWTFCSPEDLFTNTITLYKQWLFILSLLPWCGTCWEERSHRFPESSSRWVCWTHVLLLWR